MSTPLRKMEALDFCTRYQGQNLSLNCKSRLCQVLFIESTKVEATVGGNYKFPSERKAFQNQNIKHSPQHSEHRVIENSACVESCIYRDAVTLVGRIESKIENHSWAVAS